MGSPLGSPSLFPEEREQPTRDPLAPTAPTSTLAPSLFPDEPDPLRQTITQGPAPDRATRVRQIARDAQLPADVVDRNFDELAKARTLPPTVDLPTLDPRLRAWLEADRTRAIAAAHDPTLPALTSRLTWGASLARGLDHLQQRFGGFLEHAGELDRKLLGRDVLGLIPVGRDMRLRNEAEANAYGPATSFDEAFRGPWEFLQWTKELVGDTLPAMVPNLASGAAGAGIGSFFGPEGTVIGGLIGALLPAGAQGIGDVQTTLKEMDPHAEAPLAVFIGGSAVGALDSYLPGHIGGRLVKTFGQETAEQIARRALTAPVKPQFLRATAKGVITGMATEGFTEAMQDAISQVVGFTGTGQPIDWRQVGEVAGQSFVGGAVLGGVFEGGTVALEHRRAQAQHVAAQQQQAFFTALGQSVEGSTLAEQLPNDLQDLVGHLTKDGPIATVYAPTETFVEYFQSQGVSPAIAAQELTGSATALADAQASGVDLAIPMGAYAAKIAPTEHNTFFAKELRLSPTSLNLREVEEATAQVADAAAAATSTEQEQQREHVRTRAAMIAARITSQARNAGQRPTDANALGQFYAQVYAALGVRLKQDPVALFERRPLAVQLSEGETFIPNAVVDAPGSSTIPASVAPRNESIAGRATRRTAHRAALVAQAVRDAQRVDPEVDPAIVRDELTFRLDALEEQAALVRDSGRDPLDLLRAVADAGGLWWEARTGGFRGEVELLNDGAQFGRLNGINGVVRREGRPPDTMVEILRQDPRFSWIEDANHLLDALDLASRPDTAGGTGAVDQFPGTEELAEAGVVPGTRWWDDSWRGVAAPAEEVDEIDFDDTSFNPDEFAQLDDRNTPDGFEVVAPYLTPSEATRLRRDTAQALLDTFQALPRDQDFADAAVAGSAKKGWYERSTKAIRAVFGMVDSVRFTALLAALSPQTSVEANLLNTVRMWRNWTDAGRPTDESSILQLLAKSVRGQGEEESVLDSWRPNVLRALTTEDAGTIVLSGPKVQSFAMNLWGHLQEVTNDAWMANFALLENSVFGGRPHKQASGETLAGKGPRYLAMSAKIRRVAQQLTRETGETWTPAHVQETVWSWTKTLYELASADDVSAVTALKEGRLSDAAITMTPDFATLLTRDASVREILDAAGYAQVLRRLDQATARRSRGRDGDARGGRGRARDASALVTPALLRSARRLDTLRQQRADEAQKNADQAQRARQQKLRQTRTAARARKRGEFYQLEPDFYSRITRAVDTARQAKASGAQWKATIRNAGVNQDEWRLVTVDTLDDRRSYTRDEVLDFLRQHEVRVGVTTLGDPATAIAADAVDALANQLYDAERDRRVDAVLEEGHGTGAYVEVNDVSDDDGGGFEVVMYDHDGSIIQDDLVDNEQAAEDLRGTWQEQIDSRQRDDVRDIVSQQLDYGDFLDQAREQLYGDEDAELTRTQYHQYVEPGADPGSYREVFITAQGFGQPVGAPVYDGAGGLVQPTDNGRRWYDGHDDYGHVENPIVRLRFNTRTAADGTRTLFLEEVQPPQEGEFEKMPEAFQKAWRELAFKWALKHAATLGVDRLAWTSGAMQAKRYNLRQVVELVEYYPHSQQLAAYKPSERAPRYRIVPDGDQFKLLDQHGREYPIAYPTEERAHDALVRLREERGLLEEAFRRYDVTPEDLPRYIGKELADRLLAQTPQGQQLPEVRPMADGRWTVINPFTNVGSIYPTEEDARRSAEARTPRRYTLEGVQLEVGGEGLTRLYDHDFVNVVRKLTKKSGADVGAFLVPFGTRPAVGFDQPTQIPDTKLAPGVTITPALREQFLGAQPLLSDEGGKVKGAFNPSTNVLRLVAGQADLSTFLHESGHYFLEVLTDLALEVDETSADAEQRQVRADAETLLRYTGFTGTLQDWKALPTDARRDQHELFARTFEQYLFDGRAPSSELRALFARFRRWLSAVYDRIRGLGIDIPDDVRGVLDRLVATDDAIAEVQAEGELVPLFTDPAAAGVDDLTFEAYRGAIAQAHTTAREAIDRRLLAEWRKEQQADWQQERGTVRQAIVDEVQQNPLLRALSVMRTGKLPDGSIPDFGDGRPLKLDKDTTVAQFGKGVLDRLPRSPRNYLYAREGGLPPDTLAELLGFGSGDALVRALVDAPKASVNRIIDAEADRRMRQRRGDQLLDGLSLHDVAEQAVYDARREVIAAELRALTQGMTQAALPPAAAVNAEALKRINATKVRDLKPGLFLQASRRASRQAFEAFASNDRAAAVAAKQQELTALALYRAAMQAKERVQSARTRLNDFSGKVSTRARLAKAGQAYLDQIDAFLERYELTKVTQKQLDRRQSLRQFLASLERQGLPHDIPDDVVDDARRTNWQELTVDELLGVADNVEQIAHLARLKGRLLKAARARELAAVTAEVASSIYEHNRKRPETIEPRHVSQRLARGLDGFIASHRKIASLAREFDGFQAGPMWEYVIRPINAAADEETQQKAAATAALRQIFDRFFPNDRNFTRKQYIPALGTPDNPRASLSREARLVAALNWGNETNRSRLLLGHNWTTTQAQAVLDTLTKTEWDFVQAVWDYYDTFWPAIADKQRRVIGVAPEKVDAIPVFTRFGEYRGGYHPIKWEGQLQASSQAFADAEVGNVQKLAAYANATTKRNHTKARTEGEVRRPVRLDFGTVFEHVGEVIHDLTHHEMLIDVNRVIRDEAVSDAIYKTHGEAAYRQFKLALQDIAVGDVPARDEVEGFLNHLRTGSTIVGLGYNLVTSALQPIGLTQSAQRIGAKWVAVGLSDWLRSTGRREHTLAWVREKSAFMRGRSDTINREIREIRSHIGVDTGRVSGWVDEALRTVSANRLTKQAIADSYFRLIQVMQITADMPTWLGEYHRAMNDPGNVDDAGVVDEARAIALADQAVRDAQGSGEIAALARVQRGGPYLKLWTNFYSFFNTTFNLWWESQRRARGRGWTPAAIGALAVDYLLLFAIPATIGELVRAAFKGDLDDPEQLAENIALGNAAYMLGSFMVGRELGGALEGFDYTGPAGARAIATTSKLIKQLPRALSDASEGDYERLAKVAGGAGLDTAGALFHFPAVQLRKTFSGLWALMEGRSENPLVLVSGPSEDER